jgi:hypothetical protein
MKIQVHEYIEFIKRFTDQSNIMSKTFFIVVPYSGIKVGDSKKQEKLGPFAGLFGGNKDQAKKDAKDGARNLQDFEEARIQIEQRVAIVEQGLARCDLRTNRLGSEEVTELFYRKFNPGELESSVQN